jgi:hypothetical protein
MILEVGNISNISSCLRLKGFEASDITLLVKAFYGVLSKDPYDDISSCMTSILISSEVLSQKVGQKKANKIINSPLGEKLGIQGSSVAMLYNLKKQSTEEVMALSYKKLKKLSTKSINVRKSTLREYGKICDWYGLPVTDTMKAGVLGSNPKNKY